MTTLKTRGILATCGVVLMGGVFAYAAYVYAFTGGNAVSEIRVCDAKGPQKQQCYNDLVVSVAQEKGIDAGLDALALMSVDKEFALNCHGATHELGKITYDLFKQNRDFSLSEKTAYCGFGFYHGFMEELLIDTGDLSQADRFCEYVDAKLQATLENVSFACYHGIGHGVVDGSNPSTWGDAEAFIADGLALCDTFSDEKQRRERCASGVFNALAIAYVTPKYRIAGNPRDPYAVCKKQARPYARKACYDQMNGYVSNTHATFSEALQSVALSAEPAYVSVAVQSLASYRARHALSSDNDPSTFFTECSAVSGTLQEDCIRGVVVGLIEFGKPEEEYKVAVDACTSAPQRSIPMCLASVTTAIVERLVPELQKKACTYISERVGSVEGRACMKFVQEALKT